MAMAAIEKQPEAAAGDEMCTAKTMKQGEGLRQYYLQHIHDLQLQELHIAKTLNLSAKKEKQSKVIQLYWRLPTNTWCKVNVYGCSLGNPKESAVGSVIRDWTS
ncbi:hypothetical protein NE237_016888 [Protea cynaroides]|uniref:Uncharacterized protein n=1 Tax=Protea cynaroides TaxID=273540 RepID=A0A9Q0HFN1_9MAGN|nr:hypothetical protein NE237_016888 [Protea cynaroides]